MNTASDDSAHRAPAWRAPLLAAIPVLLAIVLRVPLLDVPLERDEGEYAYGGQLILRGVPPYEGLYNMKLPGIYAAYAGVLAVFGESPAGIHRGLLFLNALTAVLVFLLGRRLRGDLAGVVAALMFVVMSAGPNVQGVFANAEHFVLPAALAGLWVVIRRAFAGAREGGPSSPGNADLEPSRNRPFSRGALIGGGLLLGIAVLMKQHGAAFAVVAGLFVLWTEWRREGGGVMLAARSVGLLVVAVLVPYLVTCLVMLACGVFDTFWRWTFEYAQAYTGQLSGGDAWRKFQQRFVHVVGGMPAPWLLVPVGLLALVVDRRVRRGAGLLVLLFVLSFVAICPGFFFRPHYWVLLLPAAALLGGVGVAWLGDLLDRRAAGKGSWIAGAVAGLCLGIALIQHASFWFTMSPREASRAVYSSNPFPESVDVARYLRDNTGPDDRIAVLGSEPQIYFLSGRRGATGHIYTYGLMEIHEFAGAMADEMIAEIEAAAPEYIVYVNMPVSWLQRPNSDRRIFRWFNQYRRDYDLVAMSVPGADQSPFLQQDQLRVIAQQGRMPQQSVDIWRRR